jgi:hypothetical protein
VHRLLVFAATGLAAFVLSGSAMAWSWPADGDVLRPFALGGDVYAVGQHRGIDVAGSEGSAVRAPASGTVTFAGSLPTYGRGVTIATADGYAVTLVHLGSIGVAKGDAVGEGASIGTMGWSGDAEHPVPSVHVGVRVASQAEGYVDPLGLLPPRSIPAPAPPPVQSPAPVAAPSAATTPAPAAAPAVPPTPPPPSSQPAAPAAVAQPASGVPASPSVGLPQTSAAAQAAPASAPSAAGDAPTAVDAPSAGFTVTRGDAGADAAAVSGGGTASFRVITRPEAARVATRAIESRVNGRLLAVDTSTPSRVTSRPADAAVPDVRKRSQAAEPRPATRVALGHPVSTAAVGGHQHASVPVAVAPAPGQVAARAVQDAVPPGSASPPPSKPGRPTVVRVPSVEDGARPGVLVAAVVLLLLAAAAGARAARRIGGNGALLRHHADLLRQLHAAHRARLHDGGGGRVRAPSTAARP